MNTIRVVLMNPGEPARAVEIPNTLEAMQKLVGGYLELVGLRSFPFDVWCNEEGALKGLAPNVAFPECTIAGPLFVTGLATEDGECGSFTEEQAARVAAEFNG